MSKSHEIENYEFISVKVHCQDRYERYYSDRGYETIVINNNLKESDTLFYLDDLLWIEIPSLSLLKKKLETQNVVLNVTGTNINVLNRISKEFSDQKKLLRIIAIDCSNNVSEWKRRLQSSVLWDEYEIEKLIERGKWFVSKEISQSNTYWELVDNDSSLEEGLLRFVQSIKRSRVHAEDVDSFYSTKHETTQYISDNNIQELIELLMTELLIHQPENPKQFLVSYLTNLQNNKEANTFNNDDIEAMYDMIDITGTGKMSKDQFRKALLNLGNNTQEIESKIEGIITQVDDNVDRLTFCKYMQEFLKVKI